MFDWIRIIRDFVRKLFWRKTKKARQLAVPFSGSPYLERIRAQTMDQSLKAYSRRHPDIKIVAVQSFSDAYRHLLRIGDQKQLSHRYGAGHYYHTVTLPEEYGQLILTDNVGFRGDGAIAVLKINVADTTLLVKEIRYKLTI